MAIVNRTLDISEQKDLVEANGVAIATGTDYVLHKAPRAQVIADAKHSAIGISGSPTSTLKLMRFVVGAGMTTISISGALAVQAVGTSGTQTYSLPASGSSLLNLQGGDILVATAGGTNAGTAQSLMQVVLTNIADIKPWF